MTNISYHDIQANSLKQPRRVPAHSAQQRNDVLRLLREAKARGQGLRRDDAIFAHRITQVGARINELEHLGYVIRHQQEPGARFVTYFLVGEPDQPKPLPYQSKGSPDWYEQKTGKPRPAFADNLPLFAGLR